MLSRCIGIAHKPRFQRRLFSAAISLEEMTFIQRMRYKLMHLGEGYHPKGDLVYQGTKEARMKWGHVMTFIHAGGWTVGTGFQWFYPQDGFSFRECFCFTAIAWVAFIAFNVHLRRSIVQLWVEDRRWIHVITSNWFNTERGFKVPMGYVRMAKGRFETHRHPRYNYWLCEIHQQGRYFCLYKEQRGGKYVDPVLFNHIFGHACAEVSEHDKNDPLHRATQSGVEVVPKLESRAQEEADETRANKTLEPESKEESDVEEEIVEAKSKQPSKKKKKSASTSHWRTKAEIEKEGFKEFNSTEKADAKWKNKSFWTGSPEKTPKGFIGNKGHRKDKKD